MDRAIDSQRLAGAASRRIAALTMLLAAAIGLLGPACSSAPPKPVEHRFVIPEGASAQLYRTGKGPVILPENLKVHVGDSITIVNNDAFDQEVGPYFVGGKGKVSQVFNTPGVLEGACSFTADGTYKITVLEAD